MNRHRRREEARRLGSTRKERPRYSGWQEGPVQELPVGGWFSLQIKVENGKTLWRIEER